MELNWSGLWSGIFSKDLDSSFRCTEWVIRSEITNLINKKEDKILQISPTNDPITPRSNKSSPKTKLKPSKKNKSKRLSRIHSKWPKIR